MQHLAKNVGEHHGKYSWERNFGVRRTRGTISKDKTLADSHWNVFIPTAN